MRLDRSHQVCGATVMQEEQALAKAPERCGSELIRSSRPLTDAVGEVRSHVMEGEIRVWGCGVPARP